MEAWPPWAAMVGVLLGAAAGALLIWLNKNDNATIQLTKAVDRLTTMLDEHIDVTVDLDQTVRFAAGTVDKAVAQHAEKVTPFVAVKLPDTPTIADVLNLTSKSVKS